jgi:hypothetical protein
MEDKEKVQVHLIKVIRTKDKALMGLGRSLKPLWWMSWHKQRRIQMWKNKIHSFKI